MLHRLPNGHHITLTDVRQITTHDTDKPSVSVVIGSSSTQFYFASYAAAQAYADELAVLVNAAEKAEAGMVDF